MLTTGVDIIEIPRIKQVLDRYGQRFLDRVFTPSEIDYCNGRPPNPVSYTHLRAHET